MCSGWQSSGHSSVGGPTWVSCKRMTGSRQGRGTHNLLLTSAAHRGSLVTERGTSMCELPSPIVDNVMSLGSLRSVRLRPFVASACLHLRVRSAPGRELTLVAMASRGDNLFAARASTAAARVARRRSAARFGTRKLKHARGYEWPATNTRSEPTHRHCRPIGRRNSHIDVPRFRDQDYQTMRSRRKKQIVRSLVPCLLPVIRLHDTHVGPPTELCPEDCHTPASHQVIVDTPRAVLSGHAALCCRFAAAAKKRSVAWRGAAAVLRPRSSRTRASAPALRTIFFQAAILLRFDHITHRPSHAGRACAAGVPLVPPATRAPHINRR